MGNMEQPTGYLLRWWYRCHCRFFSHFTIRNFSFNGLLTIKNLSLNDVLKYLCPGRHLYSLCPGRHLCPGIPVCNFSLSVPVVIYLKYFHFRLFLPLTDG